MAERVFTQRELNRATLARQLLQISEVVCLSAGKVRARQSVRGQRA